jgi:2-amino-4-hydroxy-6-hydroxymethyldihydropteridine diphosphokinase
MAVFIGIGSNLPSSPGGPPRATCEAALLALADAGVTVLRRSRWVRSAPWPPSDQPWYVNGVAEVRTRLDSQALLGVMLGIETQFGRVKSIPNASRCLDLDLLAFHDEISRPGGAVDLPHPRMHERGFVLLPLAELAPGWRHPVSGMTVEALIQALPEGQAVEILEKDLPPGGARA